MTIKRTTAILTALVAFSLALTACSSGQWANTTRAAQIHVDDAWAWADSAGQNSAAYMVISNTGEHDDRLVSARASIASAVEIHQVVAGHQNMMRMQEVEAAEVPAGRSAVLEPSGMHIMFLGLHEDMNPGDTLTLTLTFERAGDLEISVDVRERT